MKWCGIGCSSNSCFSRPGFDQTHAGHGWVQLFSTGDPVSGLSISSELQYHCLNKLRITTASSALLPCFPASKFRVCCDFIKSFHSSWGINFSENPMSQWCQFFGVPIGYSTNACIQFIWIVIVFKHFLHGCHSRLCTKFVSCACRSAVCT